MLRYLIDVMNNWLILGKSWQNSDAEKLHTLYYVLFCYDL